jgi:hydrogenase small subunit
VRTRRRDFLKLAGKIGAGGVYALYRAELGELFAKATDGDVHVIWLRGASDTGCTISLLQGVSRDLVDVINDFRLAVDFNPTLMTASGDVALFSLTNALAGRTPIDVLIVEGAVPPGRFCTVGEISGQPVPFETWVRDLAGVAKQVVAVGTCASFGGLPAVVPEPTSCRPVSTLVTETPLINIPGCPADPDGVFLTLATLLSGTVPALDAHLRPRLFFPEDVDDGCPLEGYYERGLFVATPHQPGYLSGFDALGKMTDADRPTRLSNSEAGLCLSRSWRSDWRLYTAGAPGIGCTEPGFPEPLFSPFHVRAADNDGDDWGKRDG